MSRDLPPGVTDDQIERAAGWRPKTRPVKQSSRVMWRCECGWKGAKPIMAECPTCPDCGDIVGVRAPQATAK